MCLRGKSGIKPASFDVFFIPLLAEVFPPREDQEEEFMDGFFPKMYCEYSDQGVLGQIYFFWTELL